MGGLDSKPKTWSLAYGACGMKPVAESLGSEAWSLELGSWSKELGPGGLEPGASKSGT